MATATASARKQPKKAADALQLAKIERVILYVKDFARAVKFYTGTLGMTLKYRYDGWAAFKAPGIEINLHHGRIGKSTRYDAYLGFAVKDFDAAYAALVKRKVKVSKIFSPCEGLRCATFTDLDGNNLGIEGR